MTEIEQRLQNTLSRLAIAKDNYAQINAKLREADALVVKLQYEVSALAHEAGRQCGTKT